MKQKRTLSLALLLVLLTACHSAPADKPAKSSLSIADGVSMTTEKSEYPQSVRQIAVVWKNDTDKELTFGEFFSLEKLMDRQWYEAYANQEVAFHDLGFLLSPHSQDEHVYHITAYTEKMEIGHYRIATGFSEVREPGDYTDYALYAEFSVVEQP